MAFFDFLSSNKDKKLHDLMTDKMGEALDTEERLAKALPKMAHSATDPFLKQGFEEHAKQTETQANRLKQAFEAIGEYPKTKHASVIKDLVDESEELMMIEDPTVRDAALVSGAKRVEENEIAMYETMRDWAKEMGHEEAVSIFSQTLAEEEGTLGKLDDLSKDLYKNANKH